MQIRSYRRRWEGIVRKVRRIGGEMIDLVNGDVRVECRVRLVIMQHEGDLCWLTG